MTPTAKRFNPVIYDLLVMDQPAGDAAAQVDLAFINQTPQADRQSLFVAGKCTLVRRDPGYLPFGDDPACH